jgi:hypothetical protein
MRELMSGKKGEEKDFETRGKNGCGITWIEKESRGVGS